MEYIVFWIFVVLFAVLGRKYKQARLCLFCISVFFLGFRYEVGTDYENYTRIFSTGDTLFLEPGNQVLYSLASKLWENEVFGLFFLYALLSYLFIFRALGNKKYDYAYSSIFIIIFTYSFLANGIRQGLAISIFFYAYKYIEQRQFIKYSLYVILAALIHTSLIIVWPLYFFCHKTFKSRYYYIILICSFAFTQFDINQIIAPFQKLMELIPKYNYHVENNANKYFSIGVLLRLISYIFLFVLAIKHKLNERDPVLFNLFFLSLIFFNMRIGSYILNRVVIIFDFFQYLILSKIMVDKVYCTRYHKLLIMTLISFYVIMLLYSIFFDEKNLMIPYRTIFSL